MLEHGGGQRAMTTGGYGRADGQPPTVSLLWRRVRAALLPLAALPVFPRLTVTV
jgi:hypothetical protein